MVRISYRKESPPTDETYTTYQTEITTYMWPGFLGEWDQTKEHFTAWELVGEDEWVPHDDIYAPPADCIGSMTTPAQVWLHPSGQVSQLLFPRASLWRLHSLPHEQSSPQPMQTSQELQGQVQQPVSLLQLCKKRSPKSNPPVPS